MFQKIRISHMKNLFLLFVFLVVLLCVPSSCERNGLRRNFYRRRCPFAERIVRDITWKHVQTNPILPAKLLRMSFHDCFVRGCDGSVLINSTSDNSAEKDSRPNLSLAGFDVIDEIKQTLEYLCPQTVSCADIVALAARDSVSFQFRRPLWEVLTGRRDGRVSKVEEADANIPSPFMNFTELLQSFQSKGLAVRDLVVLSGAHTIGVGHCSFFTNRLYNFTGGGDQDPSLDPPYAAYLKVLCSPTDSNTTVEMDLTGSSSFDSHYFQILRRDMGLFQSDATLLTDASAARIVDELTDPRWFFSEFARSMRRLNAVGVLTWNQGEIRQRCGVINPSANLISAF